MSFLSHRWIQITGLNSRGEGVGRTEQGKVIFVPFALPGEKVRVKIVEEKKKWSRGKLLDIVSSSAHRRKPACTLFESCGGCALQHLEYAEQLSWKHKQVETNLHKLGGVKCPEVLHPLGSPKPFHYRNKVTFHWKSSPKGPVLGFFQPGTNRIVEPEECFLAAAPINRVFTVLKESLQGLHIPGQKQKTQRVTIRYSFGQNEAMIVLEAPPALEQKLKEVSRSLKKSLPLLSSIFQQQGEEFRLLEGKEKLEECLRGLHFVLGPGTFFQVNPLQAERLYEVALQFLEEHGPLDYVADLHCGTGAMALLAAQKAQSAAGVDLFKPAVDDARLNAVTNRINNASFQAGSAEKKLPELLQEKVPGAALLNPPRQGCTPELLKAVADATIPRLVYISCNPATLGRDIKILGELGYAPGSFQPVDMFPQTAHIECCVPLIKK